MPDGVPSEYASLFATAPENPRVRADDQLRPPLAMQPTTRDPSPDRMAVDGPFTPPPQHLGDPFLRPATALPLRQREAPRRATPYPRHASARPNRGPPIAPVRTPIPQYPHPAEPTYANAPRHGYVQMQDGDLHMERTPQAIPAHPNIQPAVQYAQHPHPTAPGPPAMDLDDAEDDFERTPTPNGGWREIQGKKPGWQLEGLTDAMAMGWKDTGFPRCLVATAGQGACDPDESQRRELQKNTIIKAFGFTPQIYQAQAKTTGGKRNGDPPCNLVRASYWPEIEQLLAAKCVSVRGGPTLFFFPVNPPFPSLMAVYSKPEAFGETGPQLTNAIRNRLFKPLYYDRLAALFQRDLELPKTPPTDLTPNDLTGILLNSISTKEITRIWKKREIPLVAIYCDVPTADEDTWYAVRAVFRSARLGTAITGQPVLYAEPLKCGTCRGVDHDTKICYLHSLVNWYGPGAGDRNGEEAEEEEQPTHHHHRDQRGGRGFAGRGRGARSGHGRRGSER
ncbi:hypothetical protein FOMPIDRAFT_94071 [Fomitopsis schrenkii]|uniref:Uncharacterized protein n=1 Tax=Fomitopsis schrenkii TaxID=2126942 RepID=S8ETF5_FOMSC|nr:hypothetical protein FOMPIDRAFT_94071 [Fomitopsis schrenkii]